MWSTDIAIVEAINKSKSAWLILNPKPVLVATWAMKNAQCSTFKSSTT